MRNVVVWPSSYLLILATLLSDAMASVQKVCCVPSGVSRPPCSPCVESVNQYMKLVLAGLAGSAHMVSATVISLSRLLYEFHGR